VIKHNANNLFTTVLHIGSMKEAESNATIEDMTARNISKQLHLRALPRRRICALWLLALLAPFAAAALILSGEGNRPVSDPGWPNGALALANLQSRVGWWEGPPFGGGQWQFLYRGDARAFSEALTNFSLVQASSLELVVHDGPQTNVFIRESADARVDWTFTVWVPASWNALYNNPSNTWNSADPNYHKPVEPPRMDVYIGGGQVDWANVAVPANIRVQDKRSSRKTQSQSNN
jgi:hypothetical protein